MRLNNLPSDSWLYNLLNEKEILCLLAEGFSARGTGNAFGLGLEYFEFGNNKISGCNVRSAAWVIPCLLLSFPPRRETMS